MSDTSTAEPGYHEWPAVLMPTDRPRAARRAARCSAVVSRARSCFPAMPDAVLRACFAGLLFRYTGQSQISIAHAGHGIRYLVTGTSTPAELARSGRPGPAPADGWELRLEPGRRTVELHYDPALFDATTADRLLAHLANLAAGAADEPHRPVALLPLMSAAELHTVLVEWNDTGLARDDRACLHSAFEGWAARAPEAIAMLHRGRRWTYAEVNAAANRLAHHLRARGVGPDIRVGLRLTRSPNLLIGMLAVLKAGGAFVPIDPHHPQLRVAGMVEGAKCALMISESALGGQPAIDSTPQLLLDHSDSLLAGQPITNPPPAAEPESLCYIIYTSGSTGVPKAIALRHRGVTNNLDDLISRFGIGPGDSVLALSSPSFDMSIFEFIGLTAAGGTVVIPDPERITDPAHWAELIADHRVTVWNSAPALLGLLTDQLEQAGRPAALPSLRLALLGGDWVPLALPGRARHASPGLRVIVMGGATEASIHSTIFEVDEIDPGWTSIPYGRPMANQRTYILDEAAQPVPPGVAGELQLAGLGLARGYLGRPELTEARFIDWSFGEIQHERLYRTGDLACYDRDGLIRLLGRIDLQVKINGQRIELGEIESVLSGHPAVRQVALAARNNQLVAYVVLASPVASEQLIELAAERLPGYMVPAQVVVLDRLPLSPNGKVDRAALPAPALDLAPYRPARTRTERVLTEVATELLQVPRVGLDDDFLSLGGDSVRAIQLVSRARARGVLLETAEVLGLRTIAAMAAAAGARDDAAPPEQPSVDVDLVDDAGRNELARRYPGLAELWPVTAMQAGMLFESMLDDSSYRLQTIVELTGAVDPNRMQDACNRLVARHAGLRTAFVCDVADDPIQVVLGALQPPWRHVDLGHLDTAERDRAVERLLGEERNRLPDLETPPLLRFALISLTEDRSLLVLTAYHLLYDGWSEQLLAAELADLYGGVQLGPVGNFRSYLHWLARQDRAAAIRAWQATLAGLDAPTLLCDGADATQAAMMRQRVVPLEPPELRRGVGLRATPAVLAQIAWAIVLAELTGRAEVTFGVTVSGRPGELPGVESMVGLLINTVPLRVRIDPGQSIAELAAELAGIRMSMLAHEHVGLAAIHRALNVSRLFDTLLVCQSFPPAGPGNAAIGLGRIDSAGMSNYPLALLVEPDRLVVQYDERRHGAGRISRITERFRQVAAELILPSAADRTVGSLLRAGPSPHPVAEAAGHPVPPGRPPATRDVEDPGPSRTPADLRGSLCLLFADALGLERVEEDDNIFVLGCDSLKATRIIGGIRRSLGVETSIRTLFENPSVAQLSTRLRTGTARPSLRALARAEVE